MPGRIRWETDLKKALERQEAREKPVLIFFHDPGVTDSRKEDALTYPDQTVIDLIEENVVPVKLSNDVAPWADKYKVTWMPTLITVNGEGKEHHRAVGFASPKSSSPRFSWGWARSIRADRIDKALQYFDQIVEKYPRSGSPRPGHLSERDLPVQEHAQREAAQDGLRKTSGRLPGQHLDETRLSLQAAVRISIYDSLPFLLALCGPRLNCTGRELSPLKRRKSGSSEAGKFGVSDDLRTTAGLSGLQSFPTSQLSGICLRREPPGPP